MICNFLWLAFRLLKRPFLKCSLNKPTSIASLINSVRLILPLLLMFLLSDGWKNLNMTFSKYCTTKPLQRADDHWTSYHPYYFLDCHSVHCSKVSWRWALERDIIHVRKMWQKPSSEPLKPTLSDTYAEESPTIDLQSAFQHISGDAKSSITPLIVALSSHTLTLSLLKAKIKMGKMHTS